jgi:hypothetical protein
MKNGLLINNNCMDFNATIGIIIKDLKEIGEIVDDFRNYPEVPPLQVELVKSKCRYAEELILLLKTYRPEDSGEPITGQGIQKPDVSGSERLIELSNEESSEETPEQVTDAGKGTAGKSDSKKDKNEISEVIKSIPLSDLSRAIRLNERFLFIREIFGGNSNAYEEAIIKLNKAESLPDAKAIIMSYTGEAEETEVVYQLLEIVKRKLPSNG